MRLQELFEDENDDFFSDKPLSKEVETLIEKIKSECGVFLKGCVQAKSVMYRGIKSNEKWLSKSIRPDRKAVEMTKKRTAEMDEISKTHGFPATRMNSIFCTAMYDVAERWGTPYAVFVKDGWVGTIFENKKHGYSFYNFQHATDRDDAELEFVDLKPRKISSSADIAEVLNDNYLEVLIKGEGYYAIRADLLATDFEALGFANAFNEG